MNHLPCRMCKMFLAVLLMVHYVFAADSNMEEDIAVPEDLSLQDLLTMEITTGSFLDLDLNKSPLSMTIITEEMVKNSGARNMSELLEIYVPGFIYNINKWNGTQWGMRGVINDRNTKILYLVNGHKMNTQARDGFTGETVLGLLRDIERVEVLRGPAGLVYGSGAIAGIINVVTRKNQGNGTENNSTVSVNAGTDGSKSIETDLYGSPSKNQRFAVSAGFRQSDGLPNGKTRIYGNSGWPFSLNSLKGNPSDGNYGSTSGDWRVSGDWKINKFSLYFRATKQIENGGAWFNYDPWPEIIGTPSASASDREVDGVMVHWDDPYWSQTESWRNSRRSYVSQNFMAEAGYDQPIGDNTLKLKLGYDRNTNRIGYENRDRYFADYQYNNHFQEIFGEARYTANASYLLKSIPKLQLAVGVEDRIDDFGKDMDGKNEQDGNPLHKIVSDITYNTLSLFSEGFYEFTDQLGLNAGGRLDWHTRAFMANPKIALVFQPSTNHSLKLIYQTASNNGSADNYEYNRYHYDENGAIITYPRVAQSVYERVTLRSSIMQPSPSLATLHDLKPEKVSSVELTYVGKVFGDITLAPSAAWGKIDDLFGWSQDLFYVVNVGKYQYVNFDFDAKYDGKKIKCGINHTYQRPVNTHPDQEARTLEMYELVPDSTGNYGHVVSVQSNGDTVWDGNYSRTKSIVVNVVKPQITYDGKDFTSLPTNMTKIYLTFISFEWMSLNTNLRIIWGVPGRKPVVADDTGTNYNYFGYYGEKPRTGLKDYLLHRVSKKWNASLLLNLPKGFDVSLNVYDILGIDDPHQKYTINTLRLAQMFSLDQRNLYSQDQRTFGITITKSF